MSDTTISNVLAIRAQVLARNEIIRNAASTTALQPVATAGPATTAPTFGETLSNALTKVNAIQEQEDVVTEAYERGEMNDIATVSLMQNRSEVVFEATVQIRNKLLSAYKDIMNMPV